MATGGRQHISARRLRACLAGVFALTMVSVRPCRAVYPCPWPDDGFANVVFNWVPYTVLGDPIEDPEKGPDGSTGGTTPTQEADITSGADHMQPSVYYQFDAVNQVVFVRLRLANDPMTSTPDGNSNDDPFTPTTWSMLIDTDGDGFKEFIIVLDGPSGGPTNTTDDVAVYYDDSLTQAISAAAQPIFATDSAVFADSDTRANVWDFAKSRVIDLTASGGDWLLDFQVPMAAFTVGGEQLITPSTPVSFGFATANSHTNPLQKDVANAGDFTAADDTPFGFGDPGTLEDGITQNPFVTDLTAVDCGPTTISATVIDTIDVSSGVAESTVANVQFYYQRDRDGDGAPDPGTTPQLIGTTTTHSVDGLSLWQIEWDNVDVVNGTYVIWVVATDQQGNSTMSFSIVFEVTCGRPGYTIAGYVYDDVNHTAHKEGGETGTGIAGLVAKLLIQGADAAADAVPVDPATGFYEITGVADGTYSVLLDDNTNLADIAPYLPLGWIGTEAPEQIRDGITVIDTDITDQDFGLFHGSKLTGVVFRDNGIGGGVPNDGSQNGDEAGIAGVNVTATDSTGGTIHGVAVTDADGGFTFWFPQTLDGQTVNVVETTVGNYVSTGANVGTTAGTYDRATDTITFTPASGNVYTGVAFGDVPVNGFTPSHQETISAGSAALYPHTFYAGTGGEVTFTTTNTPSPVLTGWSHLLFRDANCNGELEAGEPQVTGPITTIADQQVCIIVKEFSPSSAPINAQDQVVVTAQFTYTNAAPALASIHAVTDVTIVTLDDDAGLLLAKTVDKPTAISGEIITYVVTYRNISGDILNDLVVHDLTPAFTTFLDAAYGPLPLNLQSCAIAAPAADQAGPISWTFAGALAPDSIGTVTFRVRVD